MTAQTPLARAGTLLGLLLVLSFLAFLLPQLTGADTTRAVIRTRTAEAAPDQATVDRLSAELGLDRPLPERYLAFLGDLVTGDLGLSYSTRTPVAPQLVRALGVSVLLAGSALTLAVVGGLALGVLSAARPDGPVDRLVSVASRLFVSVPDFVVGPLLVLLFAVQLDVLPATGWGTLRQALLPVTTLALFPLALFSQLTRAEVLDALRSPWVLAARGRGLPERRILRNALRSSVSSVLALLSLFLPASLGAAVVIEVIFAVPGLGQLLYNAVLASDLPVTQAGLVTLAALAVTISLAADVLRRRLDPRLSQQPA